METPSIFSSVRYAVAGVRASQSRSSSSLNTLSRLYMRCRCSTGSKTTPSAGASTRAPTVCVGLSGTASSGCVSSSACSRWNNSSYSASEMTGCPV